MLSERFRLIVKQAGHTHRVAKLRHILSFRSNYEGLEGVEFERTEAKDRVIRGALQIAASRLLGRIRKRPQVGAKWSKPSESLKKREARILIRNEDRAFSFGIGNALI